MIPNARKTCREAKNELKRIISAVLFLALLLSACSGQEETAKDPSASTAAQEGVASEDTAQTTIESDAEHEASSVSEATEATQETAEATQETAETTQEFTEPATEASEMLREVAGGRLTVADIGSYSGRNPENGSDEAVEGVAALLVLNRSEQTCQYCTLEYEIDGQTALFRISELPPGKAVWVLEATAMPMAADASCVYISDTSVFRDAQDVSLSDITAVGGNGSLTVTNHGTVDYTNLAVYYKLTYGENTYLGGIAYRITVGELKSGESRTLTAGHFYEGAAEIVGIYADGV